MYLSQIHQLYGKYFYLCTRTIIILWFLLDLSAYFAFDVILYSPINKGVLSDYYCNYMHRLLRLLVQIYLVPSQQASDRKGIPFGSKLYLTLSSALLRMTFITSRYSSSNSLIVSCRVFSCSIYSSSRSFNEVYSKGTHTEQVSLVSDTRRCFS